MIMQLAARDFGRQSQAAVEFAHAGNRDAARWWGAEARASFATVKKIKAEAKP